MRRAIHLNIVWGPRWGNLEAQKKLFRFSQTNQAERCWQPLNANYVAHGIAQVNSPFKAANDKNSKFFIACGN